MMTRLMLKFVPLMILSLTIIGLVARSLGSTNPPNPSLQGFIEGCENQPCWHGIIPGVTTIDDAKAKLLSSGYSLNSISPLQINAIKLTDSNCQTAAILFNAHVKQINISLCERVALGDFVRQFNQPEYVILDPLSIWYGGDIQLIFGKRFLRWATLSYYTPLQEVILFPANSSLPQLRQAWLDVLLQRKYCNLVGLRYHCSN